MYADTLNYLTCESSTFARQLEMKYPVHCVRYNQCVDPLYARHYLHRSQIREDLEAEDVEIIWLELHLQKRLSSLTSSTEHLVLTRGYFTALQACWTELLRNRKKWF